MNLLIDPELLIPSNRHLAPGALIRRHEATRTTFGYRSADPFTGPRCTRCNQLEHAHLWQLVDGTDIIDCERRS